MKLQQKTITKFRELINEETEYRSGPALVAFFNDLGSSDSYGQGFPSRWVYTEDRLKAFNGTSKMNECIKRIFAPINFVGDFKTLDKHITDFNQYLAFDGYKITRKGQVVVVGKCSESDFDNEVDDSESENEFIAKEFKKVALNKLCLDSAVTNVLQQRLNEIEKCLSKKAALSVVILCGGTLEGILIGMASKYSKEFNKSKCACKKKGKVLPFSDWNLSGLIDTAKDVGLLGEDVKKYSHALRDFRNYIHPYQQVASSFSPHNHTAKISWQVLQAAIYEIFEYENNKE